MSQFNDTQPIFVQIRQRIIEMILKRTAKEGEALPSVRQISADLSVNPLTVTRAYQSLVDIGVVESRRGMGMYVQRRRPGETARARAHRNSSPRTGRASSSASGPSNSIAEQLLNKGSDNE